MLGYRCLKFVNGIHTVLWLSALIDNHRNSFASNSI